MPRVPRRRTLLLACLLGLCCAPSFGPFRLPAASGRVVALDGGAPVPHAEVLQWWRGERRASDAHPVYHARFTRADGEGRFAFPSAAVTSPRIWFLRTEGPSWGVYAEPFGFQRPGPRMDGDAWVLRLAPADANARRASLFPFCNRRPEDAASRRVAELACPPRDPQTSR
ncbi:MAG: hypothetical protein HKP30_04605 [Myxococcales bacterium]|nr:hypothetical protein [Myxococcales bacterium]